MIKKTIMSLLFVLVVGIAIVWTMDYSSVKQGFNPKFCIKEFTNTENDIITYECTGVGYKVVKIQEDRNTDTKFSFFWE